jgi:hypothetical protein
LPLSSARGHRQIGGCNRDAILHDDHFTPCAVSSAEKGLAN